MRVTSTRWNITPLGTGTSRRSAAAVEDRHLAELIGSRFTVEHEFQASSPQRRGAEPVDPLDVTVPAEPGGLYVLAVRHEGSGAISFHAPATDPARRRSAGPATTVTFEIQFPEPEDETVRRSFLSKAIKGVVLKVAGVLADSAVPILGSDTEEFIWHQKGLKRGWLHVTPDTLANGRLVSGDLAEKKLNSVQAGERCLLLLHGTFSNTASAYAGLVTTKTSAGRDFFSAVAPLYGDRIFAFNHFTVSETPEENARALLAALRRPTTFDVITHSRGGLVLRNLVERSADLGPNAANFQLGKAILVASPNGGTPLATADRFEQLVSWWANILELFPENPFSTTAEYIGEAIKFLSRHVVGALPGLASMDQAGDQIRALQSTPGRKQPESYSSLVANFHPAGKTLARFLDLGIDAIFGGANDLVVPTEGGWKTNERKTWVTASQIGCFGLNVTDSRANADVIHTNFFGHPETISFLLNTLGGSPTGLADVDLDVSLPFLLRRTAAAMGMGDGGRREQVPEPIDFAGTEREQKFLAGGGQSENVLQLFLISADEHLPDAVQKPEYKTAILLATYRNARVVETIFLRGGAKALTNAKPGNNHDAPELILWHDIIKTNERIKSHVNGEAGATLPGDDDLHQLGVNLFNAMFPGTVRRLYDVARVDRTRTGKRLDIVMTSMVNWVADKPWEFAYDPNRQSFLATETVNFTRNVLTSVPADEYISHPARPLHILVVVAQPVGLGVLSVSEELKVVRRGFQALEEAGLVTVEYMLRARIDTLHERLRIQDVDILHFIGHGEYREEEDEGYLIFEDEDGRMSPASAESLRQVLCQRGIRLVFLNACETGMVGRRENPIDFNRGVAPKLVAGGIPFLVANQYKVLDVSATEFAKRFYWWLALGSTIGDAAREARVAVNYAIAGETIDWAVPVVYARQPSTPIYSDEEQKHFEGTLKHRVAKRTDQPCRGFKGVRIGLWDVNHVLPQLDEIASELNRRQNLYCFQAVEVSAPLGTWRLVQEEGKATEASLDGQEVATKLRDSVARLGMNRLVCITAFGLKDNEDSGLSLWNEDKDQRISIISEKMLLDRGQKPDVVNRFVANMIVSALAGLDFHDTDPQNCANHFSGIKKDLDEKLAYLTASYTICDVCERKLGPELSKALKAILSAW